MAIPEESEMRDKDLMVDEGQAGAALLIIIVLVVLFLIVHYWGWGPIEHFVGFIMKHIPVLGRS
jgi:hypothetical protein